METFGFYLFLTILFILYSVDQGSFDRFIKNANYKKVKELKELRKLDDEVIKDLQKRLRQNNLDDSIG